MKLGIRCASTRADTLSNPFPHPHVFLLALGPLPCTAHTHTPIWTWSPFILFSLPAFLCLSALCVSLSPTPLSVDLDFSVVGALACIFVILSRKGPYPLFSAVGTPLLLCRTAVVFFSLFAPHHYHHHPPFVTFYFLSLAPLLCAGITASLFVSPVVAYAVATVQPNTQKHTTICAGWVHHLYAFIYPSPLTLHSNKLLLPFPLPAALLCCGGLSWTDGTPGSSHPRPSSR